MRINNNLMAINTHGQMGKTTVNMGKTMEKLSSGLRINRGADDAAGLAISEKMRGQIRGLKQAQRNAQDGVSFVQTAEGTYNEVSNMLVRMKELGVQRANGTYSASDQANIDSELTALKAEIDGVLSNTKFNGTAITASISIAVDDAATAVTITASSYTASTGTTLAQVEADITSVSTQRANYGAMQNRLESRVKSLGTTAENLQASESRIRDTDMAQEMMTFTKNNILLQASQAMLSQANQAPQGALQLLR